ncbi:MAG TPA: gliding motility-associated C-terminal domain-containing protein [Saprospiraceae bacterium]|nr:gliding motility-associated C-terminal domain-containing protein [Saprospiraceae bacterium]
MNIKTTCAQLLLLACMVGPCPYASGQVPFERTGQVFLVQQYSNDLLDFIVGPGYNTVLTSTIGAPPGDGIDAIGFRKTDNLLYGINPGSNHIYKIGKNAVAQDLGAAGLDNSMFYNAGDVSPDGKYLVSIGSNANGADVHLAKTDLTVTGFSTTFVTLSNNGRLVDIAFDPYTGKLFGFDANDRTIVTIDINSGAVSPFPPIFYENNIFGLYFDAFGDLYAYGNAVYGIVDALFIVDKTTGKETRLATGPVTPVVDAASCPFSVELKNAAEPETVLPCSDATYSYTLANGSGETLTGVDFIHPLPPGFHFEGFLQNPFGVPVDTLSVPGALLLKNLTLPPGNKFFSIKVSVGDIAKGQYNSQATLNNLPALYGSKSISDNPKAAGFEDSTLLRVNRFDEDSLFYNWFICHGETVELDASAYGSKVHWSTGASTTILPVTQGGMYTMEAGTTCEEIVVSHNVTSATCPFTIELSLVFVPDTLFPCSELIFRFIIDNDSGEPRYNVSLADTIPPGFTFLQILKNPFGGNLRPGLPPNLISIEGMTLKMGMDTLDILVEAGDIIPGDYKNRAKIYDLPLVMGPIRLSDNPATFSFDSTSLHVLGTLSDTLFFEEIVCFNAAITLNASDLGKNFLWDDGSTAPEYVVEYPGDYHLTIFDGCRPSEIYWHVSEGDPIQAAPMDPLFIHQGEQIRLEPIIFNQGDTLLFKWTDPPGNSLSCLDCPDPVALPLRSTMYEVEVSNGVCSDSTFVEIEVDRSRRIFVPNVFSPNDDGVNDFFYLQSPDYGVIRTLAVYDRWGNAVFFSGDSVFNDVSSGWDGRFKGKDMTAGVYLWWAEIEFPDGDRQVFSGDVTVFR